MLTSVRRTFRHAFDVLATMPIILLVHHLGLAGRAPCWVVLTSVLLSSLCLSPDVQRWMAGGDLRRRVGLRLGLHVGLLIPLVIYILGWGPMLVVGLVIACLEHINLSGSRAWRPAVAWSVAGVAVGQAAIASGLLFTYLPPVQAQLNALAGTILLVLVVRRFGLQTAERERTEEALQRNEQRFRALVQHSSDMTLVLGPTGDVTYVSPAVHEMLGRAPDEVVGRPILELIAPEDAETVQRIGTAVIQGDGALVRAEIRMLHRDGSVRWHQVTLRNMLGTPAVGAVVANHRDVTDERLAQDKLAYEATHDMLTGLDNRGAFIGHLQAALAEDADHPNGRGVAVLYLDLDGFKQVNDTLGHEAGDVVLTSVARVLRRHVLGADVVGRLGGDEFAVVLQNIGSAENATTVAARLLEGLAEPVQVAGHNLLPGASIGIAMARSSGGPDGPSGGPINAADLLRRADLAMYHAKRGRGSRWALYHRDLEPASRITAEEIRTAVAQGQLYLVYQPIVALATGRLVGVEALVRWNHPTRGLVPPVEFIPVAEDLGLIGLVGEWVLRTACLQLAVWRSATPAAADVWLGVNVAPDQLEDSRMAATIASLLEGLKIPARRLVVEVTESALADSDSARATLEALHESGVRIAIDDFGTGYSSLQYLTRLPVDVLKLDQAFVAELDATPQGSAIAEAVIRLAQTLHLATTAEGIETAEQAIELAGLIVDPVLAEPPGPIRPMVPAARSSHGAADASRG